MNGPNGEPIPGGLPPPEPPQDPYPDYDAGPKGGVRVECEDPDVLYNTLVSPNARLNDSIASVSSTEFDDDLLGGEHTHLMTLGTDRDNDPRIVGTTHFESLLLLSEGRQSRPDHGYFSYERVRNISNILQGKGAKVFVDYNKGWRGKRSEIYINEDGFWIEAHFGLPSREYEEQEIRKEVADYRAAHPDTVGIQRHMIYQEFKMV